MPRKVSKLCAILAKIVTKFYNTAKKDVQWDFKLFNRVSCAVRILIENVLHPPILKAGICWQAQNAGKPHHLWQKEVGLERKSWYMLKNLAKTFFYLRINFKIPFPFSSYSFTNYSSNYRWLFCALLWIYYDVNLFKQFCSSKNMTLTCRAPVYLSLLSPNKIYHNIGKCYKRGKKHVTRSRLLCRIVIRILMSPVATAVLQLRQWSEENWPACNTNETSLQVVQFSLVQIKTPTYLNVFHSERVRDDHGVDPIFVPTKRQSVLLFLTILRNWFKGPYRPLHGQVIDVTVYKW